MNIKTLPKPKIKIFLDVIKQDGTIKKDK